MTASSPNPRRQAMRLLVDILNQKGSLSSLQRLPADEHSALLQTLCFGVCRHYHELEALAAGFMSKPLRAKDQDIHCLILLGLYQLLYLRIPDHAAINETVACVRKPWARGLVNAVLRQTQRERLPDYSPEQLKKAHLVCSHPQWLYERLAQDWPEQLDAITRANNARAPMTLRVNQQRLTRDDYLERLRAVGIEASPGQLSEQAILLDAPCPVSQLPGFAEGLVSVQDEASQLLASLVHLRPGLRVLDACAAPGGKTCALLEREPGLQLLAVDNDADRLQRVSDNLSRLSLQASVLCSDAETLPADHPPFDLILLDAPCSATGVIRRHPDIKVLRTPAQVDELLTRQRSLLEALWPRLAPGGQLLYSTCSVLKAENSGQMEHFLHHHSDAHALPLELSWGLAQPCGRQLLPGAYNQDGFYYALLQKRPDISAQASG